MFHPEYIDVKKLITNNDILRLFNIVEKHGGVLRFVGGAVRDAIAGIERSDIDLVTDMSPSEFSDMCADEGLKTVPIGIQFFTMGVIINDNFFKVTSLCSDDANTKDEWKDDAAKRDLTINAVYADEKGNVFDYYNGINDLNLGNIKFIGSPQKNIESDYIRIMRFFRFCAMFGKNIDKKSLNACIKNKDLLHKVSLEKIKEELFKIFLAPQAVTALQLIFDNGILDFLVASPQHLDDLDKLIQLENKLNLKTNIIRRLFISFEPDAKRCNRLADIFRLNKYEKDYLLALCKANLNPSDFKDIVSINKSLFKFGKDICIDKWLYLNLYNKNTTKTIEVLNTLFKQEKPIFPLSGKDLIDLGADSKLIGLYLDSLKKDWFENGCLASKADLIEKYQSIF